MVAFAGVGLLPARCLACAAVLHFICPPDRKLESPLFVAPSFTSLGQLNLSPLLHVANATSVCMVQIIETQI